MIRLIAFFGETLLQFAIWTGRRGLTLDPPNAKLAEGLASKCL